MDETIKLCLGGGDVVPEGFINIDRKHGGEVYPLTDYDDESVDEIYASHILEHFSHAKTQDVLNEWSRVLKPGGVIRVAVPDFGKLAHRYVEGKVDEHFEQYILGGHTDANDHHGAIFEEGGLRTLLRRAGFVNVTKWESDLPDCAAYPISLNLRGVKLDRKVLDAKFQRRVHAVLSCPRLAFTDNMMSIALAFRELNIPTTKIGGAYWHQGMDRAFTFAIEQDVDYVMSLDYDTVFTAEQVLALLTLMERYPEADSIAAAQVKREEDCLLVNVDGDGWSDVSKINGADIVPVKMAHFGLTIFRAASFRKFKKPWFPSHPDPDGGYGDGRIDPDVKFWHEFRAQGFKPYMASHVSVGHCQQFITWPGEYFQPIHQYGSEYEERGVPINARH